MTVTIDLPLPPGINATYRAGNGRLYKSEKALDWEREAAVLLSQQGTPRYEVDPGPLAVEIDLTVPSNAWDIDGPIKALLDIVSRYMRFNDNRIIRLTVTKRVKTYHRRVVLRVVPVVVDGDT